MSENDWRIHLFVREPKEVEALSNCALLPGLVRPAERQVYLFPPDCSPPGLEKLTVQLIPGSDGWFVTMPSIPGLHPVTIHQLSEIHARTPFKRRHCERLAASTVVLIGLGSMGCSVAVQCARAGVDRLILADPDVVETANISRHEADLLDVGRPKVEVAAERLQRINPRMEVVRYHEDIFQWPDELLDSRLGDVSAFVESTDRRSAKLMTNELALRLLVPAIFLGCYEEARGGEVFWTIPGTGGACYACLREGLTVPPKNHQIDYSRAQHAEDYVGEPGLHAAVDQITNVGAQIVVAVLLRDEPDSQLGQLITPQRQYLLVGTALAGGFPPFRKPFDVYFQPLKGPRHDCPACSRAPRVAAGGAACP